MRYDPCPINKKHNFGDCEHSLRDIERWEQTEYIRKIVREELKNLGLIK